MLTTKIEIVSAKRATPIITHDYIRREKTIIVSTLMFANNAIVIHWVIHLFKTA